MDNAKRIIIPTADGSNTVMISGTNTTYHSTHGAMQESELVYIEYGWKAALLQYPDTELSIFEMGFGTGLNAFLTALAAKERRKKVIYKCCELFPLSIEEASILNYATNGNERLLFQELHSSKWNATTLIGDYFKLTKLKDDLLNINLQDKFHIIYFDAFSPTEQPELWTDQVFRNMFDCLFPGGILTTYCSKSIIRNTLKSAGFLVEKLPGPRGKREVLRATRPF
jgi:tRNA U34 5-methylaminomethyl-2-thiouridine-forming methyltransferase MnmC